MSVELLLHIGVSKTGSTSIQRWLAHVCAPVGGHVYVPDATKLPFSRFGNHKGLVLYAGSESVWESSHATRVFQQMLADSARPDREAFVRHYGESLSRCAEAAVESGCPKLLLSNEHLSERLDAPDVISFTHRLRFSFSSMTVIVYLREQSKAYVSLYGEMVTHGSRLTFEEFAGLEWVHRRFDYHRLLTSWTESGWIIRPRIYHESGGPGDNWDVVSDFADQVWPNATDKPPIRGRGYRLNASHRTETYGMMARVNSGRLPPVVRRSMLALMDGLPLFRGRFPARNERVLRQIQELHTESNRSTAKTYFGREDLF